MLEDLYRQPDCKKMKAAKMIGFHFHSRWVHLIATDYFFLNFEEIMPNLVTDLTSILNL